MKILMEKIVLQYKHNAEIVILSEENFSNTSTEIRVILIGDRSIVFI